MLQGKAFGAQYEKKSQKKGFQADKYPILYSYLTKQVVCTEDPEILKSDYRLYGNFLVYLAPYKNDSFYTYFRQKFENNLRDGCLDPSTPFQKLVR